MGKQFGLTFSESARIQHEGGAGLSKSLEFIDTGVGNTFLRKRLARGWKIIDQYPADAMDKGIDYDRYEIARGQDTLLLEWDHWSQWTVTGDDALLDTLMPELKNPRG